MRPRQWAALLFAWLYFASLVAVTAMMRFIGERWWVTGVALYLPRPFFAAPLPFVGAALLLGRLRRALVANLVAVVLVLAVLLGFVPPTFAGRGGRTPGFRVLSYNVSAALGGPDKIVDEVLRFSPDVVLLQEIGQVDALRGLLRQRYSTVNVYDQFLVATNFPILSTVIPDKILHDGRLRSPRFVEQVVETPIGRIAVYNVHPISPREALYDVRGHGLRYELASGRLFSSSHAPVFRANAGLRELQVKAFAQAALREVDPVLIAGDTNLPGLSYVLNANLSSYRDAFTTAGWGFGYTFPANRFRWMRIDRIMATDDLRFVGFQRGSSTASDHVCVVADLERAP